MLAIPSPRSLILTAALGAALAAAPVDAQINVDCSGTPFSTIQQAVNIAGPGDVIVVEAGCSGIQQAINIVNKQDLQIVGADQPVGIHGAYPVGPGQWPPSNPTYHHLGQSCVHIESSANISVTGLAFEYCVDDGVTIVNSSHVTIQGLTTYRVLADGIAVRGSFDVNLSGNFLFGATNPGSWGISVDPTSDFVRIQNNRVTKNWNGIRMRGRHLTVLNNDVSNNADVGILVESDSSTVARNSTLNNGSGVGIDFNAMPPGTCVIGNDTNGTLAPFAGCQSQNN
ncbi:MAG: right-handed parallel beta-helix repeat-containing protein [Acidobacteriota bacterium]